MKLLHLLVFQLVILCIADLGLSLLSRQSKDGSNENCAETCFGDFVSLRNFAFYDENEESCICRSVSGDIDTLNAISIDLEALEHFTLHVEECFKDNPDNEITVFDETNTTIKFMCTGATNEIIFYKPLLS